MRLIQPRATKLSDITIDQDLDMGSAGYDILLGAQNLKTTNILLKEQNTTTLAIWNWAITSYYNLRAGTFEFASALRAQQAVTNIDSGASDGAYTGIRARDTGVGYAEVARLVGATTAYIKLIGARCKLDDTDIRQAMFVWGQIAG